MTGNIEIRKSASSDVAAIEKLYRGAFPDEDLLPVVSDLLKQAKIVLSLVGVADNALLGHVIFTRCTIAGSPDPVSLLGPLAVIPARQRQGVGSALVKAGLRELEKAGMARVFVLGDPVYYGRFGFKRDDDVAPPYRLPEEWRGAWQSLNLSGNEQSLSGTLSVPQPWRQPALWAP